MTVAVGDVGDTAAEGTDYATVSDQTITIAAGAGSGSKDFTLTPTNDALVEGSERISLDGTATGLSVTDTHVDITDDDTAPTSLTLSVDADTGTDGVQSSVAEDGGVKTVRVTATLVGSSRFSSSKTVTVAVGKGGDSAAEGTDYASVSAQTITIAAGAGSGSKDFTLTPTNDALVEGSERISLDGTATGLSVTDTHMDITDDDTAPTSLTLSVDADTGTDGVQTSVAEDGGAKTVRVTAALVGSSRFVSAKTVTVTVGSDTDSATEGTDYATVGSQSILITAGSASGYTDFTLTPTDDSLDETEESLSVEGSLTGVTVSGASIAITDDDEAGVLIVESNGSTVVDEDGQTDSYTVVLTSRPTGNVAVAMTSSDPGAATVDTGSLEFTPSDWNAPQTVVVSGVRDGLYTAGQARTATISHAVSGANYEGVPARNVEVSILDRDTPPVLSVASVSVEEGGMASFTVSRTGGMNALSVGWSATTDSGGEHPAAPVEDFVSASGTLALAEGQTVATIEVQTVDDLIDEFDETFLVVLEAPGSGSGSTAQSATFRAEGLLAAFQRTAGDRRSSVQAASFRAERLQVAFERAASDADQAVQDSTPAQTMPMTLQESTGTGTIVDDDQAVIERFTDVNREILPRVASALMRSRIDQVSDCIDNAVSGERLVGISSLASRIQGQADALNEGETSLAQALGGTRVALRAGEGGDVATPGDVTLCAGGDWRSLSRDDDNPVEWDGDLFSAHMGGNVRTDRSTLVGLDVSFHRSRIDWTRPPDGPGATDGNWRLDLNALFPYAARILPDGNRLWGMVGFGTGDIRITDVEDHTETGDVRMVGGALGGVMPIETRVQGLSASLHAEAWYGAFDISGGEKYIQDLDIATEGLRVFAEGAKRYDTDAEGARLEISARLGAQYDEDAGGEGIEFGSGIEWALPKRALTMSLDGRVLSAASGVREWGLGGSVQMAPADGLGPNFTAALSRGDLADGTDALWEDGLTGLSSDSLLETSFDAEFGWGLRSLSGRGITTPFFGISLTGDNERTLRSGARMQVDQLSLELEGQHTDRRNENRPEYGIQFKLVLRW